MIVATTTMRNTPRTLSPRVLPRTDTFRLLLCLAFVMFFLFPAKGLIAPSGVYYTPFLVFSPRDGGDFLNARRGGFGAFVIYFSAD